MEAFAVLVGGLDPLAGQPGEIAADISLAVVAHGMRRIGVDAGEPFFARIEGNGFQVGIDQAHGQGAQAVILASAAAHGLDLAGGVAVHPAVGGDLLHLGGAFGDACDRLGMLHRLGECFLCLVQRGLVEVGPEGAGNALVGSKQLLGVETGKGRVMLVDAVQQHALRRGAGGLGQGCAPCQMIGIEDTGPINGAEHHRLVGTQQHQPQSVERVFHRLHRADPAPATGMAHGWRGIKPESAKGQTACVY